MKKKTIFLLSICLFLLLIFSTSSLAKFTKEQYTIDATLLENGDMYVEETIEYDTNETRNGVTRTIKLQNPENIKNSATGFVLQNVLVDGELCTEVYTGKNGQDKVYEYSDEYQEIYIKLYTPFRYKGKTVKYTYLLKNVAVEYNDIAELYWNFIGTESSDATENLTINITLPSTAAKEDIYVYGHGSDNGTFKKDGNYITLTAKNIKEKQAIDARILFSKDAVYTTKTVNENVLQKYRNLEEGMNNDTFVFGINTKIIAISFAIVIVISFIFIYEKYHKKKKSQEKYIRELPYDLEPEILQCVYYGEVKNNTFWITFLNLVKKGVFAIEQDENKVGREVYYILYRGNDKHLPEYEKKAVDIILNCMSDEKDKIELTKLKLKLKSTDSYRSYKKFVDDLKATIDSTFGENKKPKKLRIIVIFAMIFLILAIAVIAGTVSGIESMVIVMFLSITTLIYSIFFSTIKPNAFVIMFLAFHFTSFQIGNISILNSAKVGIFYIPYILLFILLIYCCRIQQETKEKQEVRGKVEALKRYIKDYSMLHEKGLEDIVLWEEYLIMAIALGINKKTVNYFYNGCMQNLNDNFGNTLTTVGSFSRFSNNFSTTFNSIARNSSGSSSYSGSRGSFSGGSRSGGGGRRRRRNRFLLIKANK